MTAATRGSAPSNVDPKECIRRKKLKDEASSVHQQFLDAIKRKGIQRIRLRW